MIRHAVLARAGGTDAERVGNGKTPIGNGWNGCNGLEPLTHTREEGSPVVSLMGDEAAESVPAVPTVTYKGSQRSAPVPETARPVPRGLPIDVQSPKTGKWETGWRQISSGRGSGSLLCSDPAGQTRLVERKRNRRTLQQEAA